MKKPLNLEVALLYPLFPLPLSLANPDGTKRTMQKSKLLETIPLNEDDERSQPPMKSEVTAYMIDMIAHLRMCLVGCSGTFEDLTLRFLQSIAKGYERVDIIAETRKFK